MRFKLIFAAVFVLAGALAFCKFRKTETSAEFFPVTEQKPFVILIPSYNNSAYIEKNLRSVFSQNYDNFRLIYIDDNSSDDTLKKAQTLLRELDTNNRATLIHNPANYGALANLYNTAHSCHDYEIVVVLSGDDFFAHENVLQTLNSAYANPNTWLTLGNALDYPSFNSSKKSLMPAYTFYTALFKQIPLEDLFYRGRFYAMGWDHALMNPLLQMADTHTQHISDILYLHNCDNPRSDRKIHPQFYEECISHARKKQKRAPLKRLPNSAIQTEFADLVIFSEDRPLQLFALLESIQSYVSGVNRISVLYKGTSSEFESGYLEVKLAFPKVQFASQTEDFKSLFMKMAFEPILPMSNYVLFAEDTLIIKDVINLSKGIHALEETGAYGLYLGHHQGLNFSQTLQRHQPIPTFFPLRGIASGETPFAWQFSSGSDDWNMPNSFHFTLYAKETLKKVFHNLDFDTPSSLLYEWGLHAPESAIGLFYTNAKSLQLTPHKYATVEALLEKFDAGFKIDLAPLFQISSPSQEMTTKVSFIPRELITDSCTVTRKGIKNVNTQAE